MLINITYYTPSDIAFAFTIMMMVNNITDFSNAFDKIGHNLLIHKLKHYGIRGKVNNLIDIFLSGRTQVVIVESEQSSYLPVNSGVPSGSLLGPSLFLYYINNIPTELDPTIRLFVDDTITYLVIKSNNDVLTLQRDLDNLSQWDNYGRWLST
jgi:hypothetical protein